MSSRFAPKTMDDLQGNPSAHKELRDCIASGEKCRVILTGDPGTGKTSAVYMLAKEFGMKVIEINSSDARTKEDLEEIAIQCQMMSVSGEMLLYLFDEIDGAWKPHWDLIEKIVTYSRHPIVMTANELRKVSKKIQNLSITIKLRRPYLSSVAKVAKRYAEQEGVLDAKFRNIERRDMRNAINIAVYGGESYSSRNIFNKVKDFFENGVMEGLSMKDSAWLFDNAPVFLSGADLYRFYELIEVASRSDIGVMSMCPTGKGSYPTFPHYWRRASRDKQQEDQKQDS